MDALDGLKALDAVVDALQHELKELHDERNVPPVERVSLAPLQWAIDKLADDLHTMETEVRDLRLSEAAARREVAELTKKASDLGVQQLTPRQVEISDSTGTDGEGQSK